MLKRVACAVSGGVDSAVAALLLKKKKCYSVTGVFMRNWDVADEAGHCSADKDAADAAYVCSHLDIPFVELNFVKEYWNDVFSQLIDGYEKGITPNPDVLCNKYIKFGRFFKAVTQHLDADYLATGHYARSSAGQFLENMASNEVKLLQSVDQTKDQTLFLSQISQDALQRTMFPVGGLHKSTVKAIAIDAGLETVVRKKESTGICFIGKREFHEFIEQYIEPRPGKFVDLETGEVVGEHKGVQYWTIGQRTHIGGKSIAYFVAGRDAATQTITVVKGTNHPALFSDSLLTEPMHWIHHPVSGLKPGHSVHCQFRFQHTYPLINCSVSLNSDSSLSVHLSRPIRALTRGQYAVLYKGIECLGSAVIKQVGPSLFELNSSKHDHLCQVL